jgi:indole-3-glycerol phosphate synthase
MSILGPITEAVREDLERRKSAVPRERLEQAISARPEGRPFSEALTRPGISLIAEYKRRSPAAGIMPHGADPIASVVRAYERGGAAALSVLTDGPHFGGSLDDLREARAASDLPILRKDFTIDSYQLYEAAAVGADAVLLVVAAVEPEELERLYAEARELDLDCLVEVHDGRELERALELEADVIGINNRDLSDFSVDVSRTYELLPDVPAGKTVVSESGISSAAQVQELEGIGVDAVLIGEALMRAPDVEQACRELAGTEEGTQA